MYDVGFSAAGMKHGYLNEEQRFVLDQFNMCEPFGEFYVLERLCVTFRLDNAVG